MNIPAIDGADVILGAEAAHRIAHTLIKASAGSGKTFRLSSRYIIALALGGSPETILATTFTRKAAGEILERVMNRLAGGATDDAKAGELSKELAEDLEAPVAITLAQYRAMLRRVCDALHRVSISTLDRRFNRMAMCFRLELGLPADPDIQDDKSSVAADLRRKAIAAMLEGGSLEENLRLLRSLAKDNMGCIVAESLDEILAPLRDLYLDSPPEAWDRFAPVGRSLTDPALRRLESQLLASSSIVKHKTIAKAFIRTADAISERDWRKCCGSGPLQKILEQADSYCSRDLADPVFKPFWTLKDHVAYELTEDLKRQTLATRELLRRFTTEFSRLQLKNRVLLFSDIPRRLSQAADESLEIGQLIAFRLDGSIRHLLLDEFQDTSPSQWNVLRPVAQEIVAEGPPAESRRSFFCVGDVKQAIYGWRGGCARIFDQVQAELRLPDSSVRSLDVSRRSAQVVLNTVCKVFGNLVGNESLADFAESAARWQRDFPSHTAHDGTLRGYCELITSLQSKNLSLPGKPAPDKSAPGKAATSAVFAKAGDDGGDAGGDDERLEGTGSIHSNFVARKIKDWEDAQPEATIGVLVMRNKTAQDYLTRLRRQGIPASGESGNPLHLEPSVSLILSALTLADHPGDSASAFHLLKSPIAKSLSIDALDAEHLAEVSSRLRVRLMEEGLAAFVSDLVLEIAPFCDNQTGAIFRLERLIEMAAGFEPMRGTLPSEFAKHVRETPVEEPSPARVRVMTINKSKGLEFDIVVLPELTSKLGNFEGAVCCIRPDPAAPPTAAPAPSMAPAALPPSSRSAIFCSGSRAEQTVNEQVGRACAAEAVLRLDDDLAKLYVAMTRARHALHMIIPPLYTIDDGKKFGTAGHGDASFATLLRKALSAKGDGENLAGDDTLFCHGDGDAGWKLKIQKQKCDAPNPFFDPATFRLASSSTAIRRSLPQVAPSSLARDGRVEAQSLLGAQSSARDKGLLFHAWFEQIEWLDGDPDVLSETTLIAAARRTCPDLDSTFVRKQLREFRACMAKPSIAKFFSRPVDPEGAALEVWREKAFILSDAGKILSGQFDRVVIRRMKDQAISAEVIDFKTDRVTSDEELESARRKYQPQLDSYRLALTRMLFLDPQAVSARLLFVNRSVGEK